MTVRRKPTGRSARGRPRVSGVTWVVGILLVLVALLAAAPSYLRARISANEAEAFADTRTVISAVQTYASANCGYFVDPHHLCNGEPCGGIQIPGYIGPDFISPELGRRAPYSKGGYVRTWTPNGLATEVPGDCKPVPGSVLGYCYASVPERVGWTGVTSYSGTGTGAIYPDPTGEPNSCPPVQKVWVCLVEGTLVDTPSGPAPIEALVVGDAVWSRDPEGRRARNRVTKSGSYAVDEHLRVTFSNGATLELTATHPVSTPNGWRAAGDLRAGDAVHDRDGSVTIDRIEPVRERVMVYDLSVAPNRNFFANGILVHNKTE